MIDPYKMVFVNIIFTFIIFSFSLVYRYIYPRRKINLFYLLISLTIAASISIFRVGAYESGDFNIHIYRSMEFYSSLIEGNLMPSWAPNLNATYGYPLFIFNYSLPYYLISFFHFLGFSFINSLKVFLFSNMILTGIFMFMFIQNKFKNDLVSFTSCIFYVFAPYHLIAIHFKITIGEILAYTLIPLCFLFVDKFIQKDKVIFLVLSGFVLGLIAISHIFIAMLLIPIIFFYTFQILRNWVKTTKNSLYILIISATISLYQWLPPFLYKNHLSISFNPVDFSKLYFPNIYDLLFSPWRFGFLFQGPKGEISNLIGYAQIIVIVSVIFLYLRNKIVLKHKGEIIFWIITLIISIFMILPQSIPIWKYFPMINAAGSHRLLLIVGFIISLLTGYLVLNIKTKRIIYLLIAITIFTTILNWGQRRVVPEIEDTNLKLNLPFSTYQGEHHYYAITKYVDLNNPWFSKIPQKKIETIIGSPTIKSIYSSSTLHQYQVVSNTKSLVRENTLYFPGWNAYIHKNVLPVSPNKDGTIDIDIPKGKYQLTLKYEDIFIYKLSKLISMISLVYIILYLILKFRRNLIHFPKF